MCWARHPHRCQQLHRKHPAHRLHLRRHRPGLPSMHRGGRGRRLHRYRPRNHHRWRPTPMLVSGDRRHATIQGTFQR